MAGLAGSLELLNVAGSAQHNAAENALADLTESLAGDLRTVRAIYVYVGYSAMDGAMKFIRKVQEMGKQVHMIACDCARGAKVRFAKELGIDVIWTWCGGEKECGEIFAQHASQQTV